MQYEDFPDEIKISTHAEKSTTSLAAPPPQRFEPNEHRDIGNFAFEQFMQQLSVDNEFKRMVEAIPSDRIEKDIYNPMIKDKDRRIEKILIRKFHINETIKLSPGEVVALAGDFFASPNPISFGINNDEKTRRFKEAYETLFGTDVDQDKIRNVLIHIETEAAATSPHAHWTVKFKKRAKHLVDADNIMYGLEMANENSIEGFWHSPYFDLALKNFDHFGEQAQIAYITGHLSAIALAKKVGTEANPDEKKRLFKQAILYELYACHFLTDLFASGHIRTPRLELLNYITDPNCGDNNRISAIPDLDRISSISLTAAGFFARKMHDEDGDEGLWVYRAKDKTKPITPDNEEEWYALGDGNYYNDKSHKNAKKACNLMITGLHDLELAYNQQECMLDTLDNFKTLIPLARPSTEEFPTQNPPMFYVEGGKLFCRGDATQLDFTCDDARHLALVTCRLFNVTLKRGQEVIQNVTTGINEAAAKIEEICEEMTTNNLQCSIM